MTTKRKKVGYNGHGELRSGESECIVAIVNNPATLSVFGSLDIFIRGVAFRCS